MRREIAIGAFLGGMLGALAAAGAVRLAEAPRREERKVHASAFVHAQLARERLLRSASSAYPPDPAGAQRASRSGADARGSPAR